MCLAIPVRIMEKKDDETAIVELSGVRHHVSLALVDDVAVGDYVIVHVGYALSKLDPAEAEATLTMMRAAGLTEEASTAQTAERQP
ncbi:MAG: HypC/HybG/HupF family hydrogenase formation chaperone [Proteobacteria bacterium]|nr:HypC/HybG/HupF family hydrogenase formation chaperone [Pseudomonadota bacterium]MCL2307615.1 HypC/HybG/HupF family hydrogenase formation chaperone [Pseudomonadota bacterium]